MVMNERLKELAEQAGYTKDMFGIGHWDMPECQRFSELIIRECIDAVKLRYMGDNDREDMEILRCVQDLKQKFNVKGLEEYENGTKILA
jgi:hypothetical protein